MTYSEDSVDTLGRLRWSFDLSGTGFFGCFKSNTLAGGMDIGGGAHHVQLSQLAVGFLQTLTSSFGITFETVMLTDVDGLGDARLADLICFADIGSVHLFMLTEVGVGVDGVDETILKKVYYGDLLEILTFKATKKSYLALSWTGLGELGWSLRDWHGQRLKN